MCNCCYFLFKSCAPDIEKLHKKVLASARGPTRDDCLAGVCCPKNESKLLTLELLLDFCVPYCVREAVFGE